MAEKTEGREGHWNLISTAAMIAEYKIIPLTCRAYVQPKQIFSSGSSWAHIFLLTQLSHITQAQFIQKDLIG